MDKLMLFSLLTLSPFAHAEYPIGAEQILKARTATEALGLQPGASKEDIKAAHKALAKKFFPAANTGDKLATEVMQKLNGAKDELTKAPIDPHSRSYYGQSGSADGASAERAQEQSVWANFEARVVAAKSAEERAKVRADQVRVARSAGDFATIATVGRPLNDGWRESVEFARAHMPEFLARQPTIVDLNRLAATGLGNEGQQAIYRAALANVTSPEQFLRLLKPQLSAMGGGMNWIRNYEAAISAELPRFFELHPNMEQIERLRSTLRVAYRQSGEAMFNRAARAAIKAKTGGARPGAVSEQGLFGRLMGRIARRFFAVDPSLATGVTRELVAEGEARALDDGTCPAAFVKSGGLVMTAEYRRLLALKGRDAADLVAYDCAQHDPALGEKVSKLYDADRAAATVALKTPGQRTRCRADHAKKGYDVEVTLASGQRVEVHFDTPERPRSVEIAPQTGSGNRNFYWKLDFAGPADAEVSYCAYAPKSPTPRGQLRVITESEGSFLTRLTCAGEKCDHQGFLESTSNADSNVFTSDGTLPDERRPFGELDRGYLTETAKTYQTVVSQIRGLPAEGRTFTTVCAALGGEAPATGPLWAAPDTGPAPEAPTVSH